MKSFVTKHGKVVGGVSAVATCIYVARGKFDDIKIPVVAGAVILSTPLLAASAPALPLLAAASAAGCAAGVVVGVPIGLVAGYGAVTKKQAQENGSWYGLIGGSGLGLVAGTVATEIVLPTSSFWIYVVGGLVGGASGGLAGHKTGEAVAGGYFDFRSNKK
jgi:hypothetical protein